MGHDTLLEAVWRVWVTINDFPWNPRPPLTNQSAIFHFYDRTLQDRPLIIILCSNLSDTMAECSTNTPLPLDG